MGFWESLIVAVLGSGIGAGATAWVAWRIFRKTIDSAETSHRQMLQTHEALATAALDQQRESTAEALREQRELFERQQEADREHWRRNLESDALTFIADAMLSMHTAATGRVGAFHLHTATDRGRVGIAKLAAVGGDPDLVTLLSELMTRYQTRCAVDFNKSDEDVVSVQARSAIAKDTVEFVRDWVASPELRPEVMERIRSAVRALRFLETGHTETRIGAGDPGDDGNVAPKYRVD